MLITALLNIFPMSPAGGVFIATMGVFVVLGAVFPSWRKPLLAIGGIAATAALFVAVPRLQARRPEPLQLWFLFGSIALEGVLVRVAVARFRSAGERALMLAILGAVGLHFIPMAVAFGPGCLLLALACVTNAIVGLRAFPAVPLGRFWALDGLIKIALGAAMAACAWL